MDAQKGPSNIHWRDQPIHEQTLSTCCVPVTKEETQGLALKPDNADAGKGQGTTFARPLTSTTHAYNHHPILLSPQSIVGLSSTDKETSRLPEVLQVACRGSELDQVSLAPGPPSPGLSSVSLGGTQ